jgi:maspardin
VLQRQVLKNFPTEPQESEIANSIDFMVEQLELLTQSELASRLVLNCADNYVQSTALKFDGKAVTMIDVLDSVRCYCSSVVPIAAGA